MLAGGVALGVFAWRRDPGLRARSAPADAASWRMLAVPLVLATLIGAIALLPMFRGGFVTVIGNGSDAHLAVGTAQFLQSNLPTQVDPSQPVDRVPLVWRSKPPIYLVLRRGRARRRGWRPTRSSRRSPPRCSRSPRSASGCSRASCSARARGRPAVAMGLVGMNRIELFTAMHPYFNQTWGYMATPFSIVLAWYVVRHRSRGGVMLFAGFLGVLAFAYPLALPVPLLAAIVFAGVRAAAARAVAAADPAPALQAPAAVDRAAVSHAHRAAAGRAREGGVVDARARARATRSSTGAATSRTSSPSASSSASTTRAGRRWRCRSSRSGSVLALRRAPRDIRWGIGAIVGFGVLAALFFRPREYGWYFHYKALAFVGPFIVAAAAVGLARLRWQWVSVLALLLLVGITRNGAAHEIGTTFDQLPKSMLELRGVDDSARPADGPCGSTSRPTGGCCGRSTCSPASRCAPSARC